MESTLAAALGMVAAVAGTALLSRRSAIPAPVLLLLEGVGWALLPFTPNVSINPDIVLTLVLPPLLYSAALESSLLAIRANLRWIASLAIGLVLVTTLVIGGVGYLVIPGMGLATACTLGAIVAPNDAIAAGAVSRSVPIPERLQNVFEGESLLNDATALTAYSVAVEAVRGRGFSVPSAIGLFLLSGVGGAGIGLAVAVVLHQVKRRIDDPLVENCLSLATPFLAYLPAEAAHTSGIVAVVVAGLWLGHRSSTYQSGGTRLQTVAVWRLVTFVLEGLVFLLIGLDLAQILAGVGGYSRGDLALSSAVVLATVLLIRPAWVFPVMLLSRLPRRRTSAAVPEHPLGWRLPLALSWVGMRGVVSLAAAEGLPLTRNDGSPFPQRDLIILLAFVVVVGTLLGQGLTFGVLLRRLGLSRDRQGALGEQARALERALDAGLRRLDRELADGSAVEESIIVSLRLGVETRRRSAFERLETGLAESGSQAWRRLRMAMIDSERHELIRQRDRGRLSDASLRELERQLDLEERAIDSRS